LDIWSNLNTQTKLFDISHLLILVLVLLFLVESAFLAFMGDVRGRLETHRLHAELFLLQKLKQITGTQ